MSTKTHQLSDELHAWLLESTMRESDLLRRLRDETRRTTPNPNMQIAPEQGQFMRLLCELIGARRAIEVGTFTGYSSTCGASALCGLLHALPPEQRAGIQAALARMI